MSLYLIVSLLMTFIINSIDVHGAPDVVFGYEDPAGNLFKNSNWDFETDISSSDDWYMIKATGELSTDKYTGRKSLKVHKRTKVHGSMYQKVNTNTANLKTDTNYYCSMFIKLLDNNPVDPYVTVRLFYKVTMDDGSSSTKEIGQLPYQRKDNIWKQIGGDFKTPSKGFKSLEFHLRILPTEVDYLVDTASLIELKKPNNIKTYLNNKIKQHRQSGLTIKGQFPRRHDLAKTRIKVELIRHEFNFGVALKALIFNRNDATSQNYRKFILDTFNSAGFENDMKWRQMEAKKGVYKYQHVDNAIATLEQNNFTIRAHAIAWDNKKNNPDWVQSYTGAALETELNKRLDSVVKRYKGKILEWDVLNECNHGHYFEDTTGKYNIMDLMHKRAHKIDSGCKMCLNDYEVIRTGRMTSAQATLARTMQAKGVPVHCVGVQSHLRVLPMDMEVLEKRTQIACSAGIPVSVTELSFHSKNEAVKAEGVDLAYRVYFSEPCVDSVMIWGFSDQPGLSFINDMYLTTGVDMKPNAAGQKMVDFINKEWRTQKTYTPTRRSFEQTLPATHGTYKLSVTTGGNLIHEETFYVHKAASNQVDFSV